MIVAEVDPAGIVTVGVAPIASSGLLLVIVTTAPPAGAAEAIVTVPTLSISLGTAVGLTVNAVKAGAMSIVIGAETVAPA